MFLCWLLLCETSFYLSHKLSTAPTSWKHAVISPIRKCAHPTDPDNYRLISLTSVILKIFETIVCDQLRYLRARGTAERPPVWFLISPFTGRSIGPRLTHLIGFTRQTLRNTSGLARNFQGIRPSLVQRSSDELAHVRILRVCRTVGYLVSIVSESSPSELMGSCSCHFL